jgi:hypothetical protein
MGLKPTPVCNIRFRIGAASLKGCDLIRLLHGKDTVIILDCRFYTALALHDLTHEMPLPAVAAKYGATKGMLQSLQQAASTFAGNGILLPVLFISSSKNCSCSIFEPNSSHRNSEASSCLIRIFTFLYSQ